MPATGASHVAVVDVRKPALIGETTVARPDAGRLALDCCKNANLVVAIPAKRTTTLSPGGDSEHRVIGRLVNQGVDVVLGNGGSMSPHLTGLAFADVCRCRAAR